MSTIPPQPGNSTVIDLSESAAGEEDPGAALDAPHPGDEAAPGTPGTGEGLCRSCGGSGRTDDGRPCPNCDGTGKVTVGIGGA